MVHRSVLFLLLAAAFALAAAATADDAFQRDCTDPHNKDIVCNVQTASCDFSLPPVADSRLPPEAHDVRVEAYAKARRNSAAHDLHVDVSWQLTNNKNSQQLRAFLLEIEGDRATRCFLFNISRPTDANETETDASPRFHFSSESLFSFAEPYDIRIHSLPGAKSKTPTVTKHSVMPAHPEHDVDSANATSMCKGKSNPQASKWTAGFRRIFLHSLAKTIQIEFVGAPAQFCFEAYEVRLLDETGLELLHSHVIETSEMKTQQVDGKTISFGEHNFTELELDTVYIPSVLPLERASDGRCLCPISDGSGPIDLHHVVCSCIAADWKRVKLEKIQRTPVVCLTCGNETLTTTPKEQKGNGSLWLLLLAILLLVLLCSMIYVLIRLSFRYRRQGKSVRIRFVADGNATEMAAGGETGIPLVIGNDASSILLVYSHDSRQHEEAVALFAELLRDVYGLKVHMDRWDESEMEANLAEYINSSIVRADKVVIVNSEGAFRRVEARTHRLPPVCRRERDAYDGLFAAQIDLAMQHARLLSCRFSYTPSHFTLPALSPLLQYTVPDNLPLLAASLAELTGGDSRLTRDCPPLQRLNASIARAKMAIDNQPDWFALTHAHQRPVEVESPHPLPPASASSSLDSGVVETQPFDSDTAPLIQSPSTPTPNHDSAYHSGPMEEEDVPASPVVHDVYRKHDVDPNHDSGLHSGEFVSQEVR